MSNPLAPFRSRRDGRCSDRERFELQVRFATNKVGHSAPIEGLDVQDGNDSDQVAKAPQSRWCFEQAGRDVVQIEIHAQINEFMPRERSDTRDASPRTT
jgi:hypothetical protein